MVVGVPHQWSLSQASRLLTVARLLFTPDSGFYLKNSKALGLFREDPDTELLNMCREKMLAFFDSPEYLEQLLHFCYIINSSPTAAQREELATSALAKLMLEITDTEKAKIWGWLIKESFRQGDILDISNPSVDKYWRIFCNKLKKIAKAREFDSTKIVDCVFTFIEKLKEIKADKSARAFESYIDLAKIIMHRWEQENTDPEVSISSVLGMLLGPSLFTALKLQNQIFSYKKHEALAVKLSKESKFSRTFMQAILCMQTLENDFILAEDLVGRLNQLTITDSSEAQTVYSPQFNINPLFDISAVKAKKQAIKGDKEDIQVHMNPLFGKMLPDSMRRSPTNK
ncbi:hypothetical protein CC99x_006125 [Candidatus Berkiella cookevillensis]|uniref:Uncharacterized protein n=1 Tax=Candidatus Berkiella cookevillensis TaxID=437022 RepID=A0A0Q9YSM3_9GAMM|nr:hypothetical protein [Candidatus Berkiella cookevillensis]MCS5708482.1 hypothetical protein [Candidatus Berkiella cookevillensis]